jgi:beta-N-acetylhexosaminidase
VELPPEHARFLERLGAVQPKTILVSFGNPYIAASVPTIPTYLCAFDNAKALQETAAEALAGKRPISGHLPVTIQADMPYGFGIKKF